MPIRPFLFILLLFLFSPLAHAAPMEEILNSLGTSLADEREQIQKFEKSLALQKDEATRLQEEIRNLRLLMVSSQNLLINPEAAAADLEKARAGQAASLENIDTRIRSLTQAQNEMQQARLQAEERIKILTEQGEALKTGEEEASPDMKTARQDTEKLLVLMREKLVFIEESLKISSDQIKSFSEAKTESAALSEKLQEAQQSRKATELFERTGNIMDLVSPSKVMPTLSQTRDSFLKLFSPAFWQAEAKPILEASIGLLIRVLIISLLLIPVAFRGRSFFRNLAEEHQANWRGVFFEMGYRSAVLIALALFAELLCQTQTVLAGTEFFKMFTNLLWTFAVYRVLTALLKACQGENRPNLTEKEVQVLKGLTHVFGIFAPILVFSTWLMGSDSLAITVERIVMEIFVVFIVFRFWGKIPREEEKGEKLSRKLLRAFTKTVAVGAPLLELFGYGSLALFWFWGWGVTILGIAFYFMLLAVIREWAKDPERKKKNDAEEGASLEDMAIKVLPILLLPIPILSFALAWGVQGSILPSTMEILTYPVSIGEMKFSIWNCFKAVCALLLTLLFNYGFGFFLEKRVFKDSKMEKGLQASIQTLLSYLFWAIGILIALRILGFNATSLAVVFGAMSVGLGFGLQNIFNNFVSGIILLFERPIQVGDVIEIDGTLGKVTKINVRSTVVQTYDNASLIVPNANFMSSKLINWSFKDQRVRKNVDVGVAYGTDVKKVEKLLLEIANNMPSVLRYPSPDVVFRNFGDSSLDFRLRFWANLDKASGIENKIRMAIATEFDKAGVEIPFPQQDLHIRSDFRVAEKENPISETTPVKSNPPEEIV